MSPREVAVWGHEGKRAENGAGCGAVTAVLPVAISASFRKWPLSGNSRSEATCADTQVLES